ncbi:MAG: hypothetical protein IKR57_01355 [Bacilli bacterium]|nr:hypothetical protein [Bacilli bacterium]
MLTFYINDEIDFEKIRKYTNKEKAFRIIIKNDIAFSKEFKPIDNLFDYNIYIDGRNHTLSNIEINDIDERIGLFKKVGNLYVKNLNINNSHLYGGVLSGIICGDVEHETKLNNINLENVIVSSEAYGGGVVGYSETLSIKNSKINTEVHGFDVVGGVVGMTNEYLEVNCDIDSVLYSVGKCYGNNAGYCERKRINPISKQMKRFRGFHLL